MDKLMQSQSSRVSSTCILISATAFGFAAGRSGYAETKIRTISVPYGGQAVAAKTDAAGTIHLVFNSDNGPQYATSANDGQTFTEPLTIVDAKSHESGLSFSAWDVAIGAGGRIHVAMSSNAWELKRPKEEWALYYARLDPGATAFSAVKNINRTPSEGFSVTADDQGNVALCWLSGKLFANISRDNGETFDSAREIDPAIDPCDCCTTSCTNGADGKLAILYREETDNQRDMFLVQWDPKRNKSSRSRVSTTLWEIDGCPMTYFTVTRASHGFVAVWPTKGQVHFARLNGEGVVQPPGEIKTTGVTGMRIGLLALSDMEGNTLIAWKQLGQLMWQVYDGNGLPTAESGTAPSDGNGVAGVLSNNGEFILFR
jgi:hypothetical protein